MGSSEKHKKNLVQEWLEGEEEVTGARAGSADVLASRLKIQKLAVSGKFRLGRPSQPPPKPEPALVREAGPSPKPVQKHSQATSREHLLKLERLPKLRAPVSTPSTRPKPKGAARQQQRPTRRLRAWRAAGRQSGRR
jgi:hypothetical protein